MYVHKTYIGGWGVDQAVTKTTNYNSGIFRGKII